MIPISDLDFQVALATDGNTSHAVFLYGQLNNEVDDAEVRRLMGPGPEFIKLFSCSTQLSLKFIQLINVKMPTIVGILTFKSRINYKLLSFELEFSNNFDYFSIYEQLKFHAQPS